ncbi:MAG TPA: class I SAM-dependent methyltransferase [Steroidobacteraceae bacterium]|jgi:SAM-dependent methyltransferase|nr:class I SAM-dependent methyltransferase [Steroidobacteraceae bacterium]
MAAQGYVEQLRVIEVRQALHWLPPGRHILEIGAGVGWQARELSTMGHEVEAVDLAGSAYAAERIWAIRDYDGEHLPYADQTFDVVYSSNVLEHVERLRSLLAEMRRVVKPGGYLVHLVPSASWRLWTTLTYYPDLVRRAWRSVRGRAVTPESAPHAAHGRGPQRWRRLLRVFAPPAHGLFGNAIEELWYFKSAHWRRLLSDAELEWHASRPAGLFYSGSILFGLKLPFSMRRQLAPLLGSSCHLFILRKRAAAIAVAR